MQALTIAGMPAMFRNFYMNVQFLRPVIYYGQMGQQSERNGCGAQLGRAVPGL